MSVLVEDPSGDMEHPGDQRLGKTGMWSFVTSDPKLGVLARAEWGTEYWFALTAWAALPVVVPEEDQPALERMRSLIAE